MRGEPFGGNFRGTVRINTKLSSGAISSCAPTGRCCSPMPPTYLLVYCARVEEGLEPLSLPVKAWHKFCAMHSSPAVSSLHRLRP